MVTFLNKKIELLVRNDWLKIITKWDDNIWRTNWDEYFDQDFESKIIWCWFFFLPSSQISSCVRTVDTVMCLQVVSIGDFHTFKVIFTPLEYISTILNFNF